MKGIIPIFLLLVAISPAFSQKEVFTKSSLAIQGYDPVAYFKESKPVKGKKEFSHSWKGAVWNFSNAQNLADFKTDPERYAPQFGGYCAYGVADGHKAPTAPDAWTIVDNKLYLNYDKSVRDMWNKSQSAYIKKANDNWAEVKKEKD